MFAYYAKWIPRYSDHIRPLIQSSTVPLSSAAVQAFKELKTVLADATLQPLEEGVPYTVETDASNFCISATLNQNGRPVAFHSRTLSSSEMHHSAVEKEAYAIVEALRKWYHLLIGHHFTLVTDQRSVAFMFDKEHSNKIKNSKIMRWRIEISPLSYSIIYRPGNQNKAPDTLTRAFCSVINDESLLGIHQSLCHPGVTRMLHFVKTKNLPYSIDDIKRITSRCRDCAEVKPRFYKPEGATLVKATRPFERLNLDFKGPLPSVNRNKYILTVIDEYSRFPYAFICSDLTTKTVIDCLTQLFTMFGMPSFVHSDRGSSFMSVELKSYLHSLGIASSRTTPYHPQGNGQCERYNGIIWQAVVLALRSRGLAITQWAMVLAEALHSIRSLLCTATNSTPHDRLFNFERKSSSGASLPGWLSTPGTVLLRRQDRTSKYDPIVRSVELLHANPSYAHVRLPNGRETTVSLRDLAPPGDEVMEDVPSVLEAIPCETNSFEREIKLPTTNDHMSPLDNSINPPVDVIEEAGEIYQSSQQPVTPRRSQRISRQPNRLNL